MNGDPYAILGIDRTASEDEVRSAYRNLAKKHHPDLHQDEAAKKKAEEKFKKITEAYNAITNPDDTPIMENGQGFGAFDDLSEILRQFRDAGGPFGPGTHRTFHFDIGQGGFSVHRQPQYQETLHFHYGIPIADIKPGEKTRVEVMFNASNKKILELKIPDDVHQGQNILLKNKGPNGEDIVIQLDIVINSVNNYRIRHRDLIYSHRIDAITASIGGAFKYEHWDGRTFDVSIPPGTNTGTKLRMKKLGLAEIGDLYIEFEVHVSNMSKYRKQIEGIISNE